MRVVYHHC